jgi:light-regulated signal transduction histidine kinase (bacteriophytochrome)
VSEQKQENITRIDCRSVLSETLANLQASIEESGAVITFDPLPAVAAEKVALIQVFQNLISNSIKYRGERTPRIHVSAEKEADGWLFAVRDNGIGIDAPDIPRLFGMFKRLHGNEIAGTGIGLALCRKVIERRGGRIWAESERGRGSTFKFTVPDRVPGKAARG